MPFERMSTTFLSFFYNRPRHSRSIPRRDSPNRHSGPISGYSFQAFRFAQRLSTAIRGIFRFCYNLPTHWTTKIVFLKMIIADFLVSWNFKHIVNIERIRGYNSINIKNGYKQLEIRSPSEFEKYEDDWKIFWRCKIYAWTAWQIERGVI